MSNIIYEMDNDGIYRQQGNEIPTVEQIEKSLQRKRCRFGLMRMEYLQENQALTFEMYWSMGVIQGMMEETHQKAMNYINNYMEHIDKNLQTDDYIQKVQELNQAMVTVEELAIKEFVEVYL